MNEWMPNYGLAAAYARSVLNRTLRILLKLSSRVQSSRTSPIGFIALANVTAETGVVMLMPHVGGQAPQHHASANG
jgi:hypothetical protein